MKGYRKGLNQLAEEGVVQIFTDRDGAFVIGAVGNLQFESFQYRLEDEYRAPTRLEVLPFECSRWVLEEELDKFSSYDMIVRDESRNPAALFKSEYRLKSLKDAHPDITLLEHPPR